MSYRANVTDKQQTDIERAADQSAERFSWFDGRAIQTGEVKSVRALNLQAKGNTGSTSSSAQRQFANSGHAVGSHNDHPARFDNPGKA